MTSTGWLITAMVLWIAIGVVQAMALGRRGFDGSSWFLIGMVLGPMSIPIAINCVRRDQVLAPKLLEAPPSVHPAGTCSVLIGFDGSPEAKAATGDVVRLLGSRIGRLGLVSVVPFDAARDVQDTTEQGLTEFASEFAGLSPILQVVQGHPATALMQAAESGRYDMLAVGTTGRGRAHLFGSAAKELAHRSAVPVLLAGQSARVDDPNLR